MKLKKSTTQDNIPAEEIFPKLSPDSASEGSNAPPEKGVLPAPGPDLETRRRLLPRIETLLLLLGLICTLSGKLIVVWRSESEHLIIDWVRVSLSDLLFFTLVYLLIQSLYLLKPRPFMARFALLITVLIAIWSVLNLGWLIDSGVQLQPGVLLVLLRDPKEFWPLVKEHIQGHLRNMILLGLLLFGVGGCLVWRFIRPRKVIPLRLQYAQRVAWLSLLVIGLLLLGPIIQWDKEMGFTGEVLGFSSHWYALIYTFNGTYENGNSTPERHIPRMNQRRLGLPGDSPRELPNIVFVLLESVSHAATTLADPNLSTTPHLAQLARAGVEFRFTRVPVSHTNKCIWAALTGSHPVIQPDHVESVPSTTPYEGLPSILSRAGYRSGFFQMSKGTFECQPGLFNNLAFDWAWFRENLEDPSAHLGHLGGDDCRMIEPALEWIQRESQPFFLMLITSVSHDPYVVPEWFGKSQEEPQDNYLHAVRYTDYFLKQLCEGLKEKGLDSNTLLSVMGDHGTSFRAQVQMGRWCPYEEVIRVPWIIHWPGHLESGRIFNQPCSQLDFTPTILKLIGFDIRDAEFEGRDAFTATDPKRRFFFSSWYANSPIGFVEGNRKIVYWPYPDKLFEYDLGRDPHEIRPRTIPPEKGESIKQEILRWQDNSQISIPAKRFTHRFLFSHWQTFSQGRSAWTYYVP